MLCDRKQHRDLPTNTAMYDYYNTSNTNISKPERLRVKRVLFGRVDHESIQRTVQEEMVKQLALSSKKWNFDFVKEKTIDPNGIYIWEEIKSQVRCLKRKNSMEDECDNSELYFDAETMQCKKQREEVPKVAKKDDSRRKLGVQTKMTDYLSVKKHISTAETTKKTSSMSIKKSRLTAS